MSNTYSAATCAKCQCTRFTRVAAPALNVEACLACGTHRRVITPGTCERCGQGPRRQFASEHKSSCCYFEDRAEPEVLS